MHSNALAIVFALTSALMIAVGTVWRHQILRAGLTQVEANAAPLASISRPAWWLSLSLAFGAYGMQALALAFGSLLVVQPVLVLSLMLTLVLAARVEKRRMEADETFWALVLTACVGTVVILGRPLPGERVAPTWEWMLTMATGLCIAGTVFAIAYRRPLPAPTKALLYGIVCGAVFGYLAVFSKSTVDAFARGGAAQLVVTWQFWALLATSVIGTAVQQYAFGAGVLSRSLPAMKIVEPLIALLLGFTLLGESFAISSLLGWAVIIAAIVGMMVATGMISRKPVG
ncbi:DMT family transporter [Corynebacterium sp.]|uniref:DMT family transporter n=1 Tax=Corynebacterium sp. TaxID=1720 RepID=UPI002A91A1C1|nr:DMT family transporter [Corynebacterium sp.]MDY5786394.1 DMT family transporter [Corynebacterium sp.]